MRDVLLHILGNHCRCALLYKFIRKSNSVETPLLLRSCHCGQKSYLHFAHLTLRDLWSLGFCRLRCSTQLGKTSAVIVHLLRFFPSFSTFLHMERGGLSTPFHILRYCPNLHCPLLQSQRPAQMNIVA